MDIHLFKEYVEIVLMELEIPEFSLLEGKGIISTILPNIVRRVGCNELLNICCRFTRDSRLSITADIVMSC